MSPFTSNELVGGLFFILGRNMGKKSDQFEIEKRIHEISLLLKRKPVSWIVHKCSEKWDISERQVRKYIKKARNEWKKYFEKLQGDGIGYHISQMKELKDQAYDKKIVIGKGENKQVINVPDLQLILDISKEEAKLMGIYPAEKKEIDLTGNITLQEIKYTEEDLEEEKDGQ